MNDLLKELNQLWEEEKDEVPLLVQEKKTNPMWQSAKRWKFTPSKVYELRELVRKTGTVRDKSIRVRFLRDVGVNHLFQRRKGWYTCWTDNQLVGWDVKEIRG